VLVLDTSVLVYAANEDSAFPLPCWWRLEEARGDPAPAFLTWSIRYEFLRVTTHPRALQAPWRSREACRFIADLLASTGFEMLVATPCRATVTAGRSPSCPVWAAT